MKNNENKSKYSNSLSKITEGQLEKMRKQFKQFEGLAIRTKKRMEAFNRIAQQAQDVFGPILEQQRKLQEFGRQIRETTEQVRDAMQESGWWLTPFMMIIPYSFLSQAAKDYS